MSDFEFIPPQRAQRVSFAVEPAYNGLASLLLITADLSGFGPWVQDTASALSPEQLRTNCLVCDAAAAHLDGVAWPSFPAWVDDIAARDPLIMRQRSLVLLLEKLQMELELAPDDMPSAGELLADRAAYLSLMERAYLQKGESFDADYYDRGHDLLQDPVVRKDLIVGHLRQMWDEHLARAWDRNLPLIQESAAALGSIDYSGRPAREIVRQVTARDDIPRAWENWLAEAEDLIFIPSPHIGPYLALIDLTGTTARIVLGARVPQGTAMVSPALSRSELLTHLGTLADDTRLRILELLAHEGELSAQQVIARLEISQSSSSRHLRQLVATGYVAERRQEGAKVYSLNPGRMENMLGDLQRFLR